MTRLEFTEYLVRRNRFSELAYKVIKLYFVAGVIPKIIDVQEFQFVWYDGEITYTKNRAKGMKSCSTHSE